jgi:SnoaL-like domain
MITVPEQAVGERLVQALAARDFEALRGCLAPTIRVRALTPRRMLELYGVDEALFYFRRWFGASEDVDVQACELGAVAGRLAIAYRFELSEEGGRWVVEQHGFADVADGAIAALDFVCSGFRGVER